MKRLDEELLLKLGVVCQGFVWVLGADVLGVDPNSGAENQKVSPKVLNISDS